MIDLTELKIPVLFILKLVSALSSRVYDVSTTSGSKTFDCTSRYAGHTTRTSNSYFPAKYSFKNRHVRQVHSKVVASYNITRNVVNTWSLGSQETFFQLNMLRQVQTLSFVAEQQRSVLAAYTGSETRIKPNRFVPSKPSRADPFPCP